MITFEDVPAQGRAQSSDPEYNRMLKHLNQRYEDYFTHEQWKKRFEASRRKGVPAVRSERLADLKAREKARLTYIKKRKAVPDDTAARLRWEAKEREESRKREKHRMAYAQRKRRLEKVEHSVRQIPPEVESGLIPTY